MIKLFYAMQEELLKQFAQVKTDLLVARNGMSAESVEVARSEVMKECQIFDFDPEDTENLYSVNDGVAEIPIQGMLVNKVDICSVFFGETVTTYKFIREAIAKAEADPNVDKILYNINSGGGFVSGVEVTFQSIINGKKPSVAVVGDMAASAAYWLASGADEIISVSKTGFFGSIGVAVEIINREKQDEGNGIKRVVLTNTSSKDKRPNMMTEDGQQVMIDELNAIYQVFVESILVKRSSKLSQQSIDDLGGRVAIASEAVKLGLVDRIMKASEVKEFLSSDDFDISKSSPATGGNKITKDTKDMKLKEFLESNPEAKAAYDADIVAAKGAGIEEGRNLTASEAVDADRERGASILKLAGAAVPEKVIAAFSAGMSPGDFAIAEQTAQIEARKKLDKDESNLGKLSTGGQLPEKVETEEDKTTAVEKKADAAVDKILGKKPEKDGK